MQLLNKFEDEILANNNWQLDISIKSERNCEEIKNYINQIIEEIIRLKRIIVIICNIYRNIFTMNFIFKSKIKNVLFIMIYVCILISQI